LLELMTNIFHQRGLGDFDEWPLLRFEPTGKVQQVVGVDAQRAKRELPDALTVQESVRPGQFLSTLFVKDTIRGSTGRSGTAARCRTTESFIAALGRRIAATAGCSPDPRAAAGSCYEGVVGSSLSAQYGREAMQKRDCLFGESAAADPAPDKFPPGKQSGLARLIPGGPHPVHAGNECPAVPPNAPRSKS